MADSLKDRLAASDLVTLMSAHNPLSARLAEEAGFDGIWASGFELSAAYGVPDASLLSFTQHLDMTRAIIGKTGQSWDQLTKDTLAKNSIKRLGVPSDIAGTVSFLASKDATYMTGQVLYVMGR